MSAKSAIINALPAGVVCELMQLRKRLAPKANHRREAEFLRAVGSPDHVLQGPFRGMKYLPVAAGTSVLEDKLGTYELELHPAVEEFCADAPDLVVDIGTATGYYAVGMAYRNPRARVVGFDISKMARELTRRLARRNGVADRVELRTEANPAALQSVLAGAKCPVVICDCEGFEEDILVPAKTPALANARLIIELHDMIRPGVSDRIRERFEPTHTVERVDQRPRTPADYPAGFPFARLSDDDRAVLAGREGDSFWFIFRPR